MRTADATPRYLRQLNPTARGLVRALTQNGTARGIPFAVALCAVAAGCTHETQTPVAASAPAVQAGATVDSGSLPPLSSVSAVAMFEAVCGASLPNFASAESRMAANGITNRAATGTVYSTINNLSFKIQDGPSFGKSCSMVFGTRDDTETFVRAAFTISPFIETPLGLAAKYRDSDALVILGATPATVGDITYHNIKILSER